jgi:hypothetical protein
VAAIKLLVCRAALGVAVQAVLGVVFLLIRQQELLEV